MVGKNRTLKLALRSITGTTADRRRARYRFISIVARRWGFKLYHRNVRWHIDEEFRIIMKEYNGDDSFTDKTFCLFYLARGVAHLEGDTVECGVASGIGSYAIIKATIREGRFHHAFDSFEGLPSPDPLDIPPKNAGDLQKGDFSFSMSQVQHNLGSLRNYILYQGWIPSRFHEVADRKFAFVHIDVDFYQPTRDSLEFFYKRITSGGLLVFDDYEDQATPGAGHAVDEFLRDKPERIIKLSTAQAFIIKQAT